MEDIPFLIAGLILGALIIWFLMKFINQKNYVSRTENGKLIENLNFLDKENHLLNSAQTKLENEIESFKKDYKALQEQKESISNKLASSETKLVTYTIDFEENKKELKLKNAELTAAKEKITELVEKNKNLLEKLENQKKELEEIGSKFTNEFKVLADQILETKSQKFTELNQIKIKEILEPLGKNIDEFKKKVEDTYDKESKQRFSLEEKIKELVQSSQKISEDAKHLALALKGDSKTQGDWGELQLELILSKAGLEKDIHYKNQETLKDETGKSFRPDYIINLPDDKCLILDSKVSLTAYEQYYNTDDDKAKERFIKEHILSINKHIQELSNKNYQNLYGINSPDYVLMFIPLEGALTVALKEDSNIMVKALEKNIVLVSTSMLLATLRIISLMWKQDSQKRYVNEIARESGALYDKFVGFINDLESLGKRIEDTKEKYSDAMNKLTTSTRKGDTIIGRMERIRTLGANSTKSIPQDLLDKIE